MTEPLLWTAAQAAAALNIEVSTFNRWLREGRIPACVQVTTAFGQGRCRRFSRRLLELWAANVDIEHVDIAELVLPDTIPSTARLSSPLADGHGATGTSPSRVPAPPTGSASSRRNGRARRTPSPA